MLQEDATQWDPMTFSGFGFDTITRFYLLFLSAAIIVTAVRLIRLWIGVPPFRLSRQADNAGYLRSLEASRDKTKQCIGLSLLGWEFVLAHEIARFALYADESRITGGRLLVRMIQSLGVLTETAVFIAVLMFIAQWHMQNRIHRLR